MPLTRISCPHCEEWVEVRLASVTRSRVCPACGESFMVQLSEGRKQRKALLIEQQPAEEEWVSTKNGLPYDSQSLSGEAYERMRLDPELEKLRRKLMGGVILVLLLCGVLIGVHFRTSVVEEESVKEVAVAKTKVPVAVPEPVPVVEAAPDFGDPPFARLFVERPKSPVLLRVWARAGSRYEGLFADSSWVRCVELRPAGNPGGPVLHAYVERKSVKGGEVEFRLRQAGAEALQWTVRVKYPPLAEEPDQVWLEEVVAESWLVKPPQ